VRDLSILDIYAQHGSARLTSLPSPPAVARWCVRRIATWWLLASAGIAACKDRAPSAADIADRGWRAHELVVAAGERAATCAEAGAAMQRVFAAQRQAFVDAIALDHDRQKLTEATEFLEAHQDRYADLETRMTALSERCADEPTVQAAFTQIESP
jgi:hypothetical protein